MTIRNNHRFCPRVECLEDRQLMTAGLTAAVPALPWAAHDPGQLSQVGQALPMKVDNYTALKAPALSPAASSPYSAFTITNHTRFNLTFSIRWDDQTTMGASGTWTSWQTYTLAPGYLSTYYIHAVYMDPLTLTGGPVAVSETAQIYFATSTTGTTQTYNLSSGVVNGVPTFGNGTHYEFLPTSSTTLNLYQGG